jgi:hypothetical protein
MRDSQALILEKVNLILAEIAELRERGPHFRIHHRFHRPDLGDCAPGEEIVAIGLVHRGREYFLPLSLSLRILFEYLVRHSRLPQSAAQIEAGVREDPFSTHHASNAVTQNRLTRSIPRSYVRVYIERLRNALELVFRKAGLPTEPHMVLLSEETVMNEVGYRLVATADWVHSKF